MFTKKVSSEKENTPSAYFVVIDMQNDFTTGALANEDAVKIIPKIKTLLSEARKRGDHIIYTRDTHKEDYLNTLEGTYLPVPHCLYQTKGWEITKELAPMLDDTILNKSHFGYDKWGAFIEPHSTVTMVGTCTDICVVSNALAIKAIEGVDVTIVADACAGLTKEKHEAALEVMRSCQCKII